jgi:very-short-patch-repair endonuclease
VLACGGPGRAVLSHRTAAAVWDLLPSPAGVEVTTLRAGQSTEALRVHRSRTTQHDVTTHRGLPVMTVTRTLVDLADRLTPHGLERVCHRAELLRLLDARAVATRMDELSGRRTTRLRKALATLAHADPQITRSELEERFLALVARYELPRPRVNAPLHGFTVDFLWRDARVVVETDGGAAHAAPRARERDHRRDAALAVAGYRVHRFTWSQVTREPGAVARTLRALLVRERT